MRCLTLCACLLVASRAACADPLAGTSLPAGTRWVMHVDLDEARLATPLWDFVRVKLVEPRQTDLLPQLTMIERMTGMKLPGDLHDVSLYSSSFDEAGVCIRIHGMMEKGMITGMLRNDPEFQQTDHNGHDVLRWRDRGHDRLMYAGFQAQAPTTTKANTWVVLSPDSKSLELALDAMDGKATLNLGSPLLPADSAPGALKPASPIFWMAAEGLADLPRVQKVESPVLSQTEAASFAVRWTNDRVATEMRMQAKTEKTAQELQAVAEGVKAFVSLSAADEHALPRTRLLSAALQQLSVQVEGRTVKANWSVEVEKIELLTNLALQQQALGGPLPPRIPSSTTSTVEKLP